MTDKSKKWLKFALRWTIAAAGISFVLWKIEFRDRGHVEERRIPRDELWVDADVRKTRLLVDPQTSQPTANGPKYGILAAHPGKLAPRAAGASQGRREADVLLVEHPDT